jgi:Domain of unknown function (DUF6475)
LRRLSARHGASLIGRAWGVHHAAGYLFQRFRSRGEHPDYPVCLTGLATSHNNRQGYEITLPILIGNEQKARQVRLGGSDRPILEVKPLTADLLAIRRISVDERIACLQPMQAKEQQMMQAVRKYGHDKKGQLDL